VSFLRANWAVVLPAFVYLSIFPYLPELRSPNELCRLDQTRAIVDHGTMEVRANEIWANRDLSCVAIARNAAGAIIDRKPCPAVHGQKQYREEHLYPSKAPLLSLAAVPIYAAMKAVHGRVPEMALVFFGRLLCTILPAILLLIPLRRFLRAYVSPPIADVVTATYALGTLAFSYSELFMSHQTTAVLAFLCFYVLWRINRGERSETGYLLAGLLAGLTMAAEYTGALSLLPLAIYALVTARHRVKALALAIIGVLPVAVGLGLYHQHAFGSPFVSGYKFLNDAGYQNWHVGGFLGVKLPDPRALGLSFFSPLRGLFVLSPFLLLALPGFAKRFWTDGRRAELGLSLGLLALYTYFTSSFSYDSWGWTTGPRHLTPLVPFLLLPAALCLESLATRPWLAGLGTALAVLSIVNTSVLTFVNYISDSLTNGLYELAWPLLLRGYLPNSLLSIAGVPNPWAALPTLLAIVLVLLAIVALLSRGASSFAALAACTTLFVTGHALIRATGAELVRDQGTYTFMAERYVPQPNQSTPSLWK
jgi:hypothetical protein